MMMLDSGLLFWATLYMSTDRHLLIFSCNHLQRKLIRRYACISYSRCGTVVALISSRSVAHTPASIPPATPLAARDSIPTNAVTLLP